ncbi:uncharacterized protein LOC124119415 [Haliotis rufescens]|uniref:uncharacterized protein LOC124119415 n=1 Tax=Haliotis rufescens TaxID=6454 RepID=UPI00201EF875|nr:uncharacterized protein LOC124119415 [Haliotis rufescens]
MLTASGPPAVPGGALGRWRCLGGALGRSGSLGGALGHWRCLRGALCRRRCLGGALGRWRSLGGALGRWRYLGGALGRWRYLGGALGRWRYLGCALGRLRSLGGAPVRRSLGSGLRDLRGQSERVSAGEGSSNDDEDLELAHDDVASDEDDRDAAPEDVGFSETRATALSQMRQAITQIKEEKLQLKANRKQRDEKFREQKRIKLEAVSRLPDEILNSLPEKLSEEKKETDKGKQKKKEKKKHEGKKQDHCIKKQSTVFEETEDYLPLKTGFVASETGIKAMPLKDLRKRMAISQSAANFRNSRLYGDHRRRESNVFLPLALSRVLRELELVKLVSMLACCLRRRLMMWEAFPYEREGDAEGR